MGVDPIFPSKIGVICRTLTCSLSSLFLVVIGLNQNFFRTVSQVDYFEQILFTERFVIRLAWSIFVQFLRTPLFLQRIGWLSQHVTTTAEYPKFWLDVSRGMHLHTEFIQDCECRNDRNPTNIISKWIIPKFSQG